MKKFSVSFVTSVVVVTTSACKGIVDPSPTYNIPRAVTTPTLGAGNLRFVQIASGFFHSCGLDSGGRAWCWGDNQYRQSGRSEPGTPCDQTSTCILTPALVETDLRFKAIAAGTTHSCAITTAGAAYCWGGGYHDGAGILGNGQLTRSAKPVAVSGNLVFKTITAGVATCGIAQDDRAYCWGMGGSVGDGTRLDALSPVAVSGDLKFISLSAGSHVCGVSDAGVAWCWGSNQFGQIGDGRITGLGTGVGSGPTVPTRVQTSRVFKSISAGGGHTCAAALDGDVLCWGYNHVGQLGIGQAGAPQALPATVSSGNGLHGVVVGTVHSCALKSDGAAACWGSNWFGGLGDGKSTAQGTGSEQPSPTLAQTSQRFTQIAPGGSHTCALAVDGRVWCWGDRARGQIGDGRS